MHAVRDRNSYGGKAHLQYHIANLANNKEREVETKRDQRHTGERTKCGSKSQEKAPESQYPRDQAGPEPFSLRLGPLSVPPRLVRWLLTPSTESGEPLPGWERTQSSIPDNHRDLHSLSNLLPFSHQPAKIQHRSTGEK
ncbi:hypothetical protein EYF80_001566 [Liparis tanakae]|uniref:Uncharacterized protein n=1 Tax=Liparis tanakae TaxID=230148 RepID=A0A4Z2JDV1_9TELE|nr:hypothetical protein EYF80_001566 [Liparis tanakae]